MSCASSLRGGDERQAFGARDAHSSPLSTAMFVIFAVATRVVTGAVSLVPSLVAGGRVRGSRRAEWVVALAVVHAIYGHALEIAERNQRSTPGDRRGEVLPQPRRETVAAL